MDFRMKSVSSSTALPFTFRCVLIEISVIRFDGVSSRAKRKPRNNPHHEFRSWCPCFDFGKNIRHARPAKFESNRIAEETAVTSLYLTPHPNFQTSGDHTGDLGLFFFEKFWYWKQYREAVPVREQLFHQDLNITILESLPAVVDDAISRIGVVATCRSSHIALQITFECSIYCGTMYQYHRVSRH